MKNIIVGTAGHIDHGKTTLIRALTGRNTDRWEEEQRRGITIDLGFTWFDLPRGDRVGIIDVPGHEKFINNMVAGVVGMDLVLLVIAADEGIMPQTREHIDILGLLGIEKSIIVLNKCDLVDEDWLEMVKEDIAEELKGSFCENAPVAEVSSVTGQGLPELIALIERMTADEVTPKDIDTMINKKSGILGVSQTTSDNRDIEEGARNGNKRYQLIENMLCHQLTKYIGGFAAAMGGIDAVVFTGGIGENNPQYRTKVAEKLGFMGVEIDEEINQKAKRTSDENDISTANAKVKMLVIPTNEELMIARDTLELVK